MDKELSFVGNMTLDFAKQIAEWVYTDEYAVYNMPSFTEMVNKNYSLVNPERAKDFLCFALNNELVGYVKINKKPNNIIFLGIGLKPNLTGKGLGKKVLTAGIEQALFSYPNVKLMLEVRSWNARAIKCYTAVGFKEVETKTVTDHLGNQAEFVIMEYVKG